MTQHLTMTELLFWSEAARKAGPPIVGAVPMKLR